jgi:hypothetical protein
MAVYRAAMFVVDTAMILATTVTQNGRMMCKVRSCFLSECQPLTVIQTTQRM